MSDPVKKAQADAEMGIDNDMNIDPMLRSSTPDVTVEEVGEDDELDNSMETQDGNDEDGDVEFVDGKTVTDSSTTSPIAIPVRSHRDACIS